MTEYKELIAISKKAADEWRNNHAFYQAGTLIDSLCYALETMQAERDTALRAQQAKMGRSQWEGCVVCNRCGIGGSNKLFCNGTEAKYCPFCGRPLTEEAWAELERRINCE